MYIVTAELKDADTFNPIIFAKAAVVNKANQYSNIIPLTPKILFAIKTNNRKSKYQ